MSFYVGVAIGSLITALIFVSLSVNNSPSIDTETLFAPLDEAAVTKLVNQMALAPQKCSGVKPQLAFTKAWSTNSISYIWMGIGEQQSIHEMLEQRGWKKGGRTIDKADWADDMNFNSTDAVFGDVMTLKKFLADPRYRSQEGKLLVNAVVGAMTITMSKINAWKNLEDVFRRSGCKLQDAKLLPIQYELSEPPQCADFFTIYGDQKKAWVLKLDGSSQGKAVTFHTDMDPLKHRFAQCDGQDRLWKQQHQRARRGPRALIQQYIPPFLIDGCKSDYRSYMLIASTTPFIVFWREGYFRRSMVPFDMNADPTEHPEIHLTNSAFQSNQPGFSGDKHIWSPQRTAEYAAKNGFFKTPAAFRNYMLEYGQWMAQLLFKGAEPYLERNRGTFELIGLDFMFSDTGELYFIEANAVPGISARWPSDWQKHFYWDLADDMFELVIKLQTSDMPELLSQPMFSEVGGPDPTYGNWRLVWHEQWHHGFVPPKATPPCPCHRNPGAPPCNPDYFSRPLCTREGPVWVNERPV